jgi:phage portal protein BeeE
MVDAEVQKSMTYQNVLERRKEFMAYTLAPYICAIEDRLSMDDLSARGTKVRFMVDETYLRADPAARLAVIEKLLTLGLITLDQAMEMEDLTPMGNEDTNATNVQ